MSKLIVVPNAFLTLKDTNNLPIIEFGNYYITEDGNIKGDDPKTNNIISIYQKPNSDMFGVILTDVIEGVSNPDVLVDKCNFTVGSFISFDSKKRILITDKGYEIFLPENKMDKSKHLKDRTKKILNELIKKNE